jgi:hypothetical protein
MDSTPLITKKKSIYHRPRFHAIIVIMPEPGEQREAPSPPSTTCPIAEASLSGGEEARHILEEGTHRQFNNYLYYLFILLY